MKREHSVMTGRKMENGRRASGHAVRSEWEERRKVDPKICIEMA